MRVILLDKISSLGDLGDQINVKGGFARNFLIPKGKAILANQKNIEFFEIERNKLEENLAKTLSDAKFRAEKINALDSIRIASKAGSEGKLFGSIGARDIANAVSACGTKVFKNEVRLPNGNLRVIGQHKVNFQFHSKVFATLLVEIVAK